MSKSALKITAEDVNVMQQAWDMGVVVTDVYLHKAVFLPGNLTESHIRTAKHFIQMRWSVGLNGLLVKQDTPSQSRIGFIPSAAVAIVYP